jgi:SAM-dependent methyltransferase
MEMEVKQISTLVDRHFGKHAVVLGVPSQYPYLNAVNIPCHSLITPLHHKENEYGFIESHFQELPLLTGSVDLAILPHTHELIDNPRQLITEACRIIKPEGMIAITGFNLYSLWGLWHLIKTKHKKMPWKGHPVLAQQVKNWLQLYDFNIENHQTILFRPLIKQVSLFERLALLDKIGRICTPRLGCIYIVLARAKVSPLTPIKLKWRQQLTSIRMSTSFSGYSVRREQK